jgi:hypothetical protein
MIRVIPAHEPSTFHSKVREPGQRAIAEMVGESPPRSGGRRFKPIAKRRKDIPADKFPDYWTEALDDLMVAYRCICAYSCFRIHPVTGSRSVDHMVAKSRAWKRVYEWNNYRLASSLLNARKNNFSDVLDPFKIYNNWFELELVGFQIVPGKQLNAATRILVQNTIDRLELNNFRSHRERDAENYWAGDVSLRILTEESPFVARELRRQDRLRPGDV